MKKYQTFTEFLMDIHATQYAGLDDEMPDDWEQWLSDLDVDELINYADKHAQNTSKIAMDNAFERFHELQNERRGITTN